MQAGGQGFKSPHLHQVLSRSRRFQSLVPEFARERRDDGVSASAGASRLFDSRIGSDSETRRSRMCAVMRAFEFLGKFADGPKGWQATKGTRWMPRRAEARKDVVSCDKRRGGAHIPRSVDVRMGEPRTVIPCDPCGEHIAARMPTRGSEPSQYPEEQKAIAIPRVAASETGRA